MALPSITRRRGDYLLSTDPSLLSPGAINAAFTTPELYWCQPLPQPDMEKMIKHSLCIGLYIHTETSKDAPTQIGLARLITDYSTLVYLTDVYVLQEYQGEGLGKWMIEAVREIVDSMPMLRSCILIGDGEKARKFYGELLDVTPMFGSGQNGQPAFLGRKPKWMKEREAAELEEKQQQ